ncbi:hypothetical protein SDC9_201356 [bioreactor metagenome]|uniref:Uncharacterized protein n=1 Tax=bioreactor metagenome TaxID=1076179 RepID=A0A645IRY0_9ZZZZ
MGPVDSAEKSCTLEKPKIGNKANEITIIPSPPIQWVRLLQYNMLLGKDSTLSKTVAPVVVKPDIVSKNASVTDGILPLRQKGNNPISVKHIQQKVTIKEPSLLPITGEALLPVKKNATPVKTATATVIRKYTISSL